MKETMTYTDALARINAWREENACSVMDELPDLDTHCEQCGFRYTEKDHGGGRCLSCGVPIYAAPEITDQPPKRRVPCECVFLADGGHWQTDIVDGVPAELAEGTVDDFIAWAHSDDPDAVAFRETCHKDVVAFYPWHWPEPDEDELDSEGQEGQESGQGRELVQGVIVELPPEEEE